MSIAVHVLPLGSLERSVSPGQTWPLHTRQSCGPHGITHLLSTTLINNDNSNNSGGHKACQAPGMVHSLDLECYSSLVSFKTGHNGTKNKSQQ